MNQSLGDWSDGGTPGHIPNPVVKTVSADGTWGAAPWESRSSPRDFFFLTRIRDQVIRQPGNGHSLIIEAPQLPEIWSPIARLPEQLVAWSPLYSEFQTKVRTSLSSRAPPEAKLSPAMREIATLRSI